VVSLSLRALFEKTVFLLGAGASMDAGCLSSQQMLASLRDKIYGLPPSDSRRRPFQSIHEFILASLSYERSMRSSGRLSQPGPVNIEDFVMVLRQLVDREFIVPAPLIGSWNDKIIGWEFQYENVFTDFLAFVTNLLISGWTRFDKAKADDLVAPFRHLMESDEPFEADIFALNYDLIWETCFNNETEKTVETGFTSGRWTGEFDDPLSVAKVRLAKLHGSVDWFFDKEAEEVRAEGDPVDEPLIIFGSAYKMQSFDPFISLLSRFRSRLQECSLYVIVGYSFQDRYINNILIQSLASKLARSAIVVDPHAESSESLSAQIEETQSSRSLNEMLNLKRVSPRRLEVVPMKAQDFYQDYLADGAKKLIEKVEKVEEGEPVF
jgi:hypothetical protein